MSSDSSLHDKFAVRQMVERFADSATRRDAQSFRELWLPDGEWTIGEPFPLSVSGLDEIESAFRRLVGQWEFFAQFVPTVLIEIEGDRASARCTCEELGINATTGKSYHNVALYFDELKRVPAGWRFSKRSYHYLWLDDRPLSGRTFQPLPQKNLTREGNS